MTKIFNINKLAYFDFDSTLMLSGTPETSIPIWIEKTGTDWPHKGGGFWSKPESLDLDVFDIEPVDFVLTALEKDNADPLCKTFLLTSRLERLTKPVLAVLKYHNIELDGYFFKKFGKEKPEVILDMLPTFPDVTSVHVWDDRDKEIDLYNKFKREFVKLGVELTIHHVQI